MIQIIKSDLIGENKQFRFPRSKKRRIREKWAKNDKNYRVIPKIYRIGDVIYCHSIFYEELKKIESGRIL